MALSDIPGVATVLPLRRRGSSDLVKLGAQVVSQLASPPVLSLVALSAVAAADGSPSAYRAAACVAGGGVLLPLGVLVRDLRRGQVSNLEITRRRERIWPLTLTAACLGLCGAIVQVLGAPQSIVGLGCILGVQAFLTLLITMRWKISVHCATATLTGVLLWSVLGSILPLLLLAPAMIWSRLVLKRHTPWEAVSGTAFGAALFIALWPTLAG